MSPPPLVTSALAARRWLALVAFTAAAATAQAQEWPTVAVPKNLNTFDIGQQVSVNGMPMRMRGFVSGLSPRDAGAAFRQSLGDPLVENRVGDKLVLGQRQGDFFVSVQVEAAGSGSRGVMAVTHLKAAYDNQAATQASADRWLAKLPAGSRLLSQMESQDAGKRSKHLVIVNSQDEGLNRDRLVSALGDEGLSLEREGIPDAVDARRLPELLANSRTLFFKGNNKDAMATVHRDGNGQTTVVLNIVMSPERLK